jgi:hypothetical protein
MMGARRRKLPVIVAALLFAFIFALVGSAEAKKKKKKAPHHKTPSGASTKEAPEEEEKEAPEEEAKPPPKAAPAETGEGEKPPGEEGEAPKKVTKKKVVAEAEPEAPIGGAPSAVEVFAGAGALFRSLAWNQNMSNGAIRSYSLAPGPEAIIGLEAYPGAFVTSGFGANIGVFGHFDYGFGVVSQTMPGVRVTTQFQDFLVGLKVRLRFGMVDPFVSVAYGGQTFQLENQMPVSVPGVSYTFIRAGLGVRLHLAPIVDVDVGGAYLIVNGLGTATNDIASQAFFPNAAGYAAEGNLSIRLRLTRLIALRAGGDFRQYGLSLHAAQGAQPYVGGAADRYIVGWGGIELVFDGLGGGAGDEEEKPVPPPPSKKPKPRRQPEPDLNDEAPE